MFINPGVETDQCPFMTPTVTEKCLKMTKNFPVIEDPLKIIKFWFSS